MVRCIGILFAATVCNGANITYLPNTNFDVNNIGWQWTQSKEACAQLCLQTDGCGAASWNSPDSTAKDGGCNLKSSGTNQFTEQGEIGILLGSAPAPPSLNVTYLPNTNFHTDNIGWHWTQSKEACAKLCLQTDGCEAASWNSPDSAAKDSGCNLKASGMNRFAAQGEIGILRNGAPAPPSPNVTYLPNTDFSSNNIGWQWAQSKEACAQLCLQTDGCGAASWNSPDSVAKDGGCNLKSSNVNPVAKQGEIGIELKTSSSLAAFSV